MSKQFPFNYLYHMLSPRKMFAGRKAYSWWQVIILVLFLNALILMPVSFHYATMPSYQMERIVDHGLVAVTEDTYKALQQGEIKDGHYSGVSHLIETDTAAIAILPSQTTQSALKASKKNVIILDHTSLQFFYASGKQQEIVLTGNQDLTTLSTSEEVRNFIDQQWYANNRAQVFAFLMIVYTTLLYLGTFLILFAGAATLRLARKAGIFSLKTFKECLGLLLNCLGYPSVLAFTLGCLGLVQNPVLIMNVQVLGTLLVLMLVLYRTGFRDKEEMRS